MNEIDRKPHGTAAAYRRHSRTGTPLCESCRQWRRRWREDHPDRSDGGARKRRLYWLAREAGLSAREALGIGAARLRAMGVDV